MAASVSVGFSKFTIVMLMLMGLSPRLAVSLSMRNSCLVFERMKSAAMAILEMGRGSLGYCRLAPLVPIFPLTSAVVESVIVPVSAIWTRAVPLPFTPSAFFIYSAGIRENRSAMFSLSDPIVTFRTLVPRSPETVPATVSFISWTVRSPFSSVSTSALMS